MNYRNTLITLLAACLLTACGGSKVVKEPEPLVITDPLASASDQRLGANLDWIIYRDGPGSWAKKVDWDEYLMRVQNTSEDPIRITDVVVIDSTGTQIERGGNRRKLIEGTEQIKSRYEDVGLNVEAGPGSWIVVGTAAATVTGVALGVSAAGYYGAAAGTAMGVAAASIILLPVVAVDAVTRGINNQKVDEQIMLRQSLFPSVVRPSHEVHLNLFFPLAPSPRQIEVIYVDSNGMHTLTIDTRSALAGLHVARDER